MQQENELAVDPEEQTEKKLVRAMALAIFAIIAGGILFLAIRPWIQRFRAEHAEQESVEALPQDTAAGIPDAPPL